MSDIFSNACMAREDFKEGTIFKNKYCDCIKMVIEKKREEFVSVLTLFKCDKQSCCTFPNLNNWNTYEYDSYMLL